MPFARMRDALHVAQLQNTPAEQFLLNEPDYTALTTLPLQPGVVEKSAPPCPKEYRFEGVIVKPSSLPDGKSWLLISGAASSDLQPIPV